MSDAYNAIPSFFSDDPKGGALTYEQLQARRKIALALATRNRGFPKNIGEGLTYLGESLGEMMGDQRAAAGEARYRRESNERMRSLLDPAVSAPAAVPAAPAPPNDGPGPMGPGIDPFGGAVSQVDPQKMAMELAPERNAVQQGSPQVATLAQPEAGPIAEATATRLPLTTEQASQQPSMSIEEWKKRIARNESGGRRDPYSTVGERSRQGDYPYGKYQVMGTNVPKWTQAYLGRKMTPEQFLKDPEAQEQVASARGGEYMTKYGPVGAAQAWFGGENWRKDPRATDTLGTHVAEYTKRFNIPLVEREQVVASAARSPGAFAVQPDGGAPSGGELPPGATPASAPAREDIAQALMAQQSPMQPQPVPQQQPAPQPMPQQQIAQAPIGTPVPSSIRPPAGPPKEPDPVPMSPQEMRIRRALGATRDPAEAGQLEAVAKQMEDRRKFEDARNVERWKNELTTYQQRTDPVRQEQLQKAQQDRAAAERERIKTEARGGVPQAVIDKGLEESAKVVAPLRLGSTALNKVDDLIDKGMFHGTFAWAELQAAKAAQALGGAPDPRVANTEGFSAAIAPIVAAARTSLVGTANISNADLLAAEKAAGGNINITKEGKENIMKTVRQMQLNMARHHQELLSTASGGDTAAERTLYGIHGLPMDQIVSRDDRSVERLMQNPDNEHERGLFNKSWHTPGLAEKIIARERARR